MMKLRKGRTSITRFTTSQTYRQSLNSPSKQGRYVKRNSEEITEKTAERIHKNIQNINKLFYKKSLQTKFRKFTRFTTNDDQKIFPLPLQQKDQRQKKGILFNIRSINIEKKSATAKDSQKVNKKTFNLTYFAAAINERCETQPQEGKKMVINQKIFAEKPPIHRNSLQQLKLARKAMQAQSYKLFMHCFVQNTKMMATGSIDREFDDNLAKYLDSIKQQCNSHSIEYNQFKNYPKQYLSYYIQTGNNDRMVMDILSKRWWWEISYQNSDKQNINFIWTQTVHKGQDLKGEAKLSRKRQSKKCNPEQILATLKLICFYNHFPNNKYLTSNISLSFLMNCNDPHRRAYNLSFPLTFYINQINSESWLRFTKCHFSLTRQSNHYWIIKNAQNKRNFNFFKILHSYQQIKQFIEENTTKDQSFIIQQYISRPMLYRNRKFDIQAYMLVTRLNGQTKGYWYKEGFINVSHEEYTMKNTHPFIHLVTDSIQISHRKFGDFENKIRFGHFEKYCNGLGKHRFIFEQEVIPIMKDTAKYLIQLGQGIIFSGVSQPTFEIFQLKFILESDRTPWLVSVNANHSLSTTSPTLQATYPILIDDTFKLTLDLYFPPPTDWPLPKKFFMSSACRQNGYELIYDEVQRDSQRCNIRKIQDIEFWEKVDEDVKIYEDIEWQRDSLSQSSKPSKPHSQVKIELDDLLQTE